MDDLAQFDGSEVDVESSGSDGVDSDARDDDSDTSEASNAVETEAEDARDWTPGPSGILGSSGRYDPFAPTREDQVDPESQPVSVAQLIEQYASETALALERDRTIDSTDEERFPFQEMNNEELRLYLYSTFEVREAARAEAAAEEAKLVGMLEGSTAKEAQEFKAQAAKDKYYEAVKQTVLARNERQARENERALKINLLTMAHDKAHELVRNARSERVAKMKMDSTIPPSTLMDAEWETTQPVLVTREDVQKAIPIVQKEREEALKLAWPKSATSDHVEAFKNRTVGEPTRLADLFPAEG